MVGCGAVSAFLLLLGIEIYGDRRRRPRVLPLKRPSPLSAMPLQLFDFAAAPKVVCALDLIDVRKRKRGRYTLRTLAQRELNEDAAVFDDML